MVTKIKQLDPGVISRIAAGESVSRPAAIVKELLENALDANATRVDVTISEGGKRLILVQDDGEGMSAEDLDLCVLRHATSKISSFEDLSTTLTYGFRGEALASIAAVSRLSISSGQDGIGNELRVTYRGLFITPAPFVQGTRIKVQDLFKEVPARLKFLRGDRAETLAVLTVIKAAALSRPDVYFALHEVGDRVQRDLFIAPSESFADRTRRVMGEGFYKSALPVSHETQDIKINGFVASSSGFRTVMGDYYVLVNGRHVRAAEVTNGVRDAFSERLQKDKHAPFVLDIQIPTQDVDVNVHPTKSEVRFKNPSRISGAVRDAVASALPHTPTRTTIKTEHLMSPETYDTQNHAFLVVGDWEIYQDEDGSVMGFDRACVLRAHLSQSGSEDLLAPTLLSGLASINPQDIADVEVFGFKVSGFGDNTHVLTSVPKTVQADPATFPDHVKRSKTLMQAALSWAMSAVKDQSLRAFAEGETRRVPVEGFKKLMERTST